LVASLGPWLVRAASETYTGAAFGEWGAASNWNHGTGPAPGSGDSITVGVSSHNDLTGVQLQSVVIPTNSAGVEITGNAIGLQSGGSITCTDAMNLDNISAGVVLNGPATFSTSS